MYLIIHINVQQKLVWFYGCILVQFLAAIHECMKGSLSDNTNTKYHYNLNANNLEWKKH